MARLLVARLAGSPRLTRPTFLSPPKNQMGVLSDPREQLEELILCSVWKDYAENWGYGGALVACGPPAVASRGLRDGEGEGPTLRREDSAHKGP